MSVIDRDTLIADFTEVVKQVRSGEVEPQELPPPAPKRGRGRPRKVHNPKTLRVPVETDVLDQFNAMNEKEGISSADKVRELISSYVNGSVR